MPAIALFDMDGTLYDHDKALKRDMIKIAGVEDLALFEKVNYNFRALENLPQMQERIDMIRKQPGWWRELDRWLAGWDVLEMAQEIGFCCKILTKGPRSKSMAWMEKVDAITRDFGENMPIDIVGKDKGGTYGRVLVDDHPPYLKQWLKWRPRGLAIMPAHDYNRGFEPENVIRYDGTTESGEEVRAALEAAYKRKSKEHWKNYV